MKLFFTQGCFWVFKIAAGLRGIEGSGFIEISHNSYLTICQGLKKNIQNVCELARMTSSASPSRRDELLIVTRQLIQSKECAPYPANTREHFPTNFLGDMFVLGSFCFWSNYSALDPQKVAFSMGNWTIYFSKIQVGEILHFDILWLETSNTIKPSRSKSKYLQVNFALETLLQ